MEELHGRGRHQPRLNDIPDVISVPEVEMNFIPRKTTVNLELLARQRAKSDYLDSDRVSALCT